ncbi:hypothetical protein, partial [Flavobacterium sp. FlaQc-48]|uniref:hypothetical protein n=1 Tax=Flavobacterium sp. FlaQc-48 TaxID=3374181 RepID=UPI0037569432
AGVRHKRLKRIAGLAPESNPKKTNPALPHQKEHIYRYTHKTKNARLQTQQITHTTLPNHNPQFNPSTILHYPKTLTQYQNQLFFIKHSSSQHLKPNQETKFLLSQ